MFDSPTFAPMRGFLRALPGLAKYQLVCKLIESLLIFPLFAALFKAMLHLCGLNTLTNENAKTFFLSPAGLVVILAGYVVMILVLVLEVGGFIVLSNHSINGRPEPSFRTVVIANFNRLPKILGPGFLIITPLMLLMLTLAGSALNIQILEGLRIPNFITSVINAKPLYAAAYWSALAIMNILVICLAFWFHGIFISGLKGRESARLSFGLIRRNWLRFLIFMALWNLAFWAIVAIILVLIDAPALILAAIGADSALGTGAGVFGFFLISLTLAAASFVVLPFGIYLLTDRYRTYLERIAPHNYSTEVALAAKDKPSKLDALLRRKRTLGATVAVVLLLASVLATVFMKDLVAQPEIKVAGHRGGAEGHAAENSVEAIEYSTSHGANFVEVDLQRTKDGQYILNHDANFARLAGEDRTPQQMTLEEIKKLDLGATNPEYRGQKVPTLAELLEACKGNTGIFLELKGASANEQMVDDAVKAIKQAGMENQVILMSLDYSIIEYAEQHYPEMQTGFVYFVGFGDVDQLTGDYLIVEEDAISRDKVATMHNAGKKVAVWTVNTQESMEKFVNWPVDVIITDNVEQWMDVSKARSQETPLQSFASLLFE